MSLDQRHLSSDAFAPHLSSPMQGLLLACNMSNLVRTLLSLHLALSEPMTKSSVLAVCRIVELLKCVQHTFHRRALVVMDYTALIVNQYELALLSYLDAASVSTV